MKTSNSLFFRIISPILLALGLAQGVSVHASVLTFDDWSFVGNLPHLDDGHVGGVTFDFKEGGGDSLDAYYGYDFFPPLTWARIQGLFGEGSAAGILTLDFDTPTPDLAFDFGLNLEENVPSAVKVTLFDASLNPLGDFFADAIVLGDFAEGSFAYLGLPVKRALLDFNDTDASRFAVDNVAFGVNVPEPGAATAAAFGLAASIGVLARRRAKAACGHPRSSPPVTGRLRADLVA